MNSIRIGIREGIMAARSPGLLLGAASNALLWGLGWWLAAPAVAAGFANGGSRRYRPSHPTLDGNRCSSSPHAGDADGSWRTALDCLSGDFQAPCGPSAWWSRCC